MTSTLSGIRILDLTRILAGPFASMLLADMGAEVIKIEEPHAGDPIRLMGPPFVNGESVYFLGLNRNKRSVTLNLKSDEGRALFYRLAATADVVVDNFRPGVMSRLKIGPDELREHKPDIITCSLSAFGDTGPYRDRGGFDLIIQAMGGAIAITGEPGGPPVRMGIPLGDLAGGMFAATSICAALARREREGVGEHIDVSLLDSHVALLGYIAHYYLADQRIIEPLGTAHTNWVPYQAFDTQTTPIVVAVAVEHMWPRFCNVIGLPELAERYTGNESRRVDRTGLVATLQERLLTRPAEEWLAELQAASIPVAPVNSIDKVLNDPQILHREMVTHVSRPHVNAGPYRVVGNPIKVRGEQDSFEPAPCLGEHNDALLGPLLNGGGPALEQLRERGVI